MVICYTEKRDMMVEEIKKVARHVFAKYLREKPRWLRSEAQNLVLFLCWTRCCAVGNLGGIDGPPVLPPCPAHRYRKPARAHITSAERAEGVSTLGVINPGFKVCRLCKNIQNSLRLQPSTRTYTCTPHADRNKNILFKL